MLTLEVFWQIRLVAVACVRALLQLTNYFSVKAKAACCPLSLPRSVTNLDARVTVFRPCILNRSMFRHKMHVGSLCGVFCGHIPSCNLGTRTFHTSFLQLQICAMLRHTFHTASIGILHISTLFCTHCKKCFLHKGCRLLSLRCGVY